MSKSKRKEPNFFIVGVPRAATTTLYEALKRHPNVFMSPEKETGFFLKEGTKDFSEYLDLFEEAEDEAVVGEATPTYLYSKRAADDIYSNIVNPKILIQLRDPVERMISQYRHNKREGQEENSLDEALLQEKRKIQEGFPKKYHYTKLSFYSSHVKRYLEIFGEKNVKITLFKDFSNDSNQVLNEIAEFLSINPQKLLETVGKHNAGNAPRFSFVNNFIQGDSRIKKLIQVVIPTQTRRKWGNKIRRDYNVRDSKVEVNITSEQKQELRNKFKADINQLEEIIDKDLGHLKQNYE